MSLCLPFTFCLCFSHVCLYITWSVKSTNTKKYENVIKITPLLYCHVTSQSPSLTTSLLHFLLLMLLPICNNDCVEELHSNRRKIYWSHHIHHAFFHVHSVTIHYVHMPASQKKEFPIISLFVMILACKIHSICNRQRYIFIFPFLFSSSCC